MKATLLPLLAVLTILPVVATAQVQLTPVEERLLAQARPGTAAEPDLGLAPIDPSADKMSLRLSDAVNLGIENNLQLQVERYDPLISFETQESSWGSFDPVGTAGWEYLSNTDPVASNALLGTERNRHKEQNGNFGVEGLLPYVGATLGVDFNINETRDIGNPFITSRPVYNSDIRVSGSIPLLKGLIWNDPWTRVKQRASAYGGSRQNFKTDLMDVVQFIETAYWDLVAQSQAVLVAEKSLETARSLLDQTETQYEVGVKSKVEVVEAEAGVAAREFDLIRFVNRYHKAQDDLIDAVFGTRLTAASRLEIEPADDPESYANYQIDTADAARKAIANRSEIKEAESIIEQQEFQLKFAKNQRLPQLDLRASYGTGGRRFEGLPVDTSSDPAVCGINPIPCQTNTPTTGDSVGDTFNDYGGNSGGETVTIGAVFSIPLGNISGRHDVSRAQLELRKAKTRLTRLRQDIILQVRDGARNLESAQEGIEAAERRRIAAAEQLRAEQVRLEYGESTPFKVLLKEQDLVEAENEKIGALFTYRKSVVDLHRAQGTILEARNIVVEDAATLR